MPEKYCFKVNINLQFSNIVMNSHIKKFINYVKPYKKSLFVALAIAILLIAAIVTLVLINVTKTKTQSTTNQPVSYPHNLISYPSPDYPVSFSYIDETENENLPTSEINYVNGDIVVFINDTKAYKFSDYQDLALMNTGNATISLKYSDSSNHEIDISTCNVQVMFSTTDFGVNAQESTITTLPATINLTEGFYRFSPICGEYTYAWSDDIYIAKVGSIEPRFCESYSLSNDFENEELLTENISEAIVGTWEGCFTHRSGEPSGSRTFKVRFTFNIDGTYTSSNIEPSLVYQGTPAVYWDDGINYQYSVDDTSGEGNISIFDNMTLNLSDIKIINGEMMFYVDRPGINFKLSYKLTKITL